MAEFEVQRCGRKFKCKEESLVLQKLIELFNDEEFAGSKDWRDSSIVGRAQWLIEMYKDAKSEIEEQCRIIGMSGERELTFQAKLELFRKNSVEMSLNEMEMEREINQLRNELDVANEQFNAAINFAIDQGIEAAVFLKAWREGDTAEWLEFDDYLAAHGITKKGQQ